MWRLIITLTLFSSFVTSADKYAPAKFEVLNSQVLSVVEAESRLQLLASNIGWGEGPVWSHQLNALLFSDIANNKVLKWSEADGLSDYLFPSGHNPDGVNGAWRGANGLVINAKGELLLAQQGSRTFAKMRASLAQPEPDFEILASHYQGKKLNSPNDLVIHKSGDLFFTDPPYGLPKFEQDPAIELPYFPVFKMAPDGKLTPVITDLIKPNGIALSMAQDYLLVTDSEPRQAKIYQYQLNEQGNIKRKTLFFDAVKFEKDGPGSTDGLKQHSSGLWFITMPNGIGILSATGEELLGRFQVGQVCNVAIDEQAGYVYFTAPNELYRLKLKKGA